MSLSCCLAQQFVDKHLNRPIAIDGSLLGMGRIPGNLPIELIADYLNDYTDSTYDIDYLMDAIQEYIEENLNGVIPRHIFCRPVLICPETMRNIS